MWMESPSAAMVNCPSRSRGPPPGGGERHTRSRYPFGSRTASRHRRPRQRQEWAWRHLPRRQHLGAGRSRSLLRPRWSRLTESLGVEALGEAGVGPVRLHRVQQPDRAAGPRFPVTPIGDQSSRWAGSRMPAVAVCRSISRNRPPAPRPSAGHRRSRRPSGGGVNEDHVGQVGEVVPQQAHDGSDTAARGDEEGAEPAAVVAGRSPPRPDRGGPACPAPANHTRWLLTAPLGMAFTVMDTRPSGEVAGDVSE
jgi:hypothetical protein